MQQDIDRLRGILSEQVIPRVASVETLRMLVADRPLRLPSGVAVRRTPAPALRVKTNVYSNLFLGKYPEERVHAIRYPYLCYVMSGEIDMRLGIPAKYGKSRGVVNLYEILELPAQSTLVIPPGVFFPDGTRPYWERATPIKDSQMFWVHILPTGVLCHTSATSNSVHRSENLDVFVPGKHFALLLNMIEEELHLPDAESVLVAQHALLLFFSRILRGLKDAASGTTLTGQEFFGEEKTLLNNTSFTIKRACEFIRRHNDTSFTIEEAAAYAYVSPSHLMRLFRSQLHMTVMEYALQQRLKVAKSWLTNSEMPISQIARSLSYRQTPQFSRAFKKAYGISPTAFRRAAYNDKNKN